jgi:hypothetical protein
MSKHTPGPWFFGVEGWDDDARRRKPVAKPFDYSGPGYYDNPSIFGANGEEIVGCDEYMVFRNPDDIRLLVAAPELLEALKNIVNLWDHHASAHGDGTIFPLHVAARAAIAKAEGKA